MISPEIIEFINQTEEIFNYSNVENIQAIYHYSIPNTKLFYPEPFIASASFMHSDLWFMHILVYQYWLWFVFIFIIVFFFITFISTVRWCNMRIKPRRETRGVSRSKCGDLITACVPVSWATSIIVNESTDAIDYYDGFGTTELVVGIRAYQWGWEYYYPKDIDLNYNIKKNYSAFIGNSLKYNKSHEINISTNNLWKFYQNKNFDQIVTPAYLLILPQDNNKILNYLSFADAGINTIYETNAFKKIKLISKVSNKNLFTDSIFTNLLNKNFFFYYNNLNDLTESNVNGLKKQQNFLSNNALLGSNTSLFNKTSFNKFTYFNFKNNFFQLGSTNIFFFFEKLNFFFFYNNKNFNFKLFSVLNKNLYLKNYFEISQFFMFNNFLSMSQSSELSNEIYTQFNLKNKEKIISNSLKINNLNLFNDLFSKQIESALINTFKKYNESYISSNNETVSSTDRNIRKFLVSNKNQFAINFNFPKNSFKLFKTNFIENGYSGVFNHYFATSRYFNQLNFFSKISNNRINLDYAYSPIISNNAHSALLNYDSYTNTFIENTPTVLQSKEEAIPNYLATIYWNFYGTNTNSNWRFFNNSKLFQINKNFYLPFFNFYYDYDFRNWQALELLEDAYWESGCPLFVMDEYLTLSKDFYVNSYLENNLNLFLNKNKNLIFKNNTLNKSLIKDLTNIGDFYTVSFYIDDYLTPTSVLKTKNFSIFSQTLNFYSNEEAYDNFKFLFFIFFQNNLNLNYFTFSHLKPFNYATVFDFFRSDFDEFSWYNEETSFLIKNLNINLINFFNIWDKQMLFEIYNLDNLDISTQKKNRFSNTINLRNTVKNAAVTHSAIQKVFKTRLDENRSHAKLNDIASSYVTSPFISSSRINYEQLLKKNKENFFKINLYKYTINSSFNIFNSVKDGLNFYFFDFPFLLSLKSDASRYIWFDWYSKWGFYEVQPSSSSRFSIVGVPYFSKNFEFNANSNDTFNETETYLIRISKARKNYLPNWTHAPYFFAKNNFWYKNDKFFSALQNNTNSLVNTKLFLFISHWYWTNSAIADYSINKYIPSHSNIKTYSKTMWHPDNNAAAYFYYLSSLLDILSKREYFYREFLLKNYKIINLPIDLVAANTNPLIQEIKINFLYVNDLSLSTEYSKFFFFNTLAQFDYFTAKLIFNNLFQFINPNNIFSSFLIYFLNLDKEKLTNSNFSEINKNQFRPLRKGITNMIRLHATGAMALPIEIRLQILASSKDVIHSWAIPSAGIKIDCVPGYSSHRVMIFLVSGIFWGQCMEICGRYHHWMPIVVYFMKRDLFFLWCSHFIFLTNTGNSWTMNEKQYTDYTRTVSFDKNSWLTELYQ